MELPGASGAKPAQGAQGIDLKGEGVAVSGFPALIAGLQVDAEVATGVSPEMAVDPETGKRLPEDGDTLPEILPASVTGVIDTAVEVLPDLPVPIIFPGQEVTIVQPEQPVAGKPSFVPAPASTQGAVPVTEQSAPVIDGTTPVPEMAKAVTMAVMNPGAVALNATARDVTRAAQPQEPRMPAAMAMPEKLKAGKQMVDTPVTVAPRPAEGEPGRPPLPETAARPTAMIEPKTQAAEEIISAEKPADAFHAFRVLELKNIGQDGLAELQSFGGQSSAIRLPEGVGPMSRSGQTAPVPEPPMTLSLRQANWDQALGNNVLWMVREDLQSATIRIKPAELGPLNIQVSVQQDQLNVNISANHAVTREALEAALPRLREQFVAQGFSQINVDISGQGLPQGQGGLAENQDNDAPVFSAPGDFETAQDTEVVPVARPVQQGLLDTFA